MTWSLTNPPDFGLQAKPPYNPKQPIAIFISLPIHTSFVFEISQILMLWIRATSSITLLISISKIIY
jgi:hypothetical protein